MKIGGIVAAKTGGIAATIGEIGGRTRGIAAKSAAIVVKIDGAAVKNATRRVRPIGIRRGITAATTDATIRDGWADTIVSIGAPTTATTAGAMTARPG